MGILNSEKDRLLKALSDRRLPGAGNPPDGCEACHGACGGVRGNENMLELDGILTALCDYCTVLLWQLRGVKHDEY